MSSVPRLQRRTSNPQPHIATPSARNTARAKRRGPSSIFSMFAQVGILADDSRRSPAWQDPRRADVSGKDLQGAEGPANFPGNRHPEQLLSPAIPDLHIPPIALTPSSP